MRPSRKWRWGAPAALVLTVILVVGFNADDGGNWFMDLFRSQTDNAFLHTVERVPMEIILREDGELMPRDQIEIKCEVEGEPTILYIVEESSYVKKGDLLVEFASESLQERLEQEQIELRRIEAELETAKQDLKIQLDQNESDIKKGQLDLDVAELEFQKYIHGDYPQSVKEVELNIEQSEMEIKRKTEEWEKHRELLKKNFVAKLRVEELAFDVRRAEMQLERHRLSKDILEKYDHPKQLKQKQSAVERAAEELERIKARADSREASARARVEQHESTVKMRRERFARMRSNLDKTKIYAPADGIVQYPQEGSRWGRDERLAAGSRATEGQTVLVLPDTSQMIVRTRIHEADRHRIAEGMRCLVTVQAVPGESFVGRIARIDKFADSESRWLNPNLKEHTTEILLEPTDSPLSPGDSAEVKILIATIDEALTVPVQSVVSRGRDQFVFRHTGSGDPEVVPVEVGQSTVSMIEVKSGLNAGDRVLTEFDESLLALLPLNDGQFAGNRFGSAAAKSGKPAAVKGQSGKPAAAKNQPARKPAADKKQAAEPAAAKSDTKVTAG